MSGNASRLLQVSQEVKVEATSQGKDIYETAGAQLSAVVWADDWEFLEFLKGFADYSKRVAKEKAEKTQREATEKIEALKNSNWWPINLLVQRVKDELSFIFTG